MLCIDFPIQTDRTYFSSSEMNATAASPRCHFAIEQCTVAHCFYRREIGTSPNCARLLQLPSVAKRLMRGPERRDGWCGSCLPPHTSDINSHESVTEAICSELAPEAVMIRCQQLMQEWRANRRRRNIIQLTRTWRGLHYRSMQ